MVKKAIEFTRKLNVPVLGVIENMAGFVCPKWGAIYDVLRSGAGRRIACQMEIRLLGTIPLDPTISEASDEGKPIVAANQTIPLQKPL